MIQVNKEKLEYLIKEYLAHTPCTHCECYYDDLCKGNGIPEEGCIARYLKYLQTN